MSRSKSGWSDIRRFALFLRFLQAYKIAQNEVRFLCIILSKKDFTFLLTCGILLLAHTIYCVFDGIAKQNIAIAGVRSL